MNSNSLETKRPSLVAAFFPIVILITLLAANVYLYEDGATSGPNQIALLMAAGMAAVIGLGMKIPFGRMLKGIEKAIGSALGAILILLLIGSLAGTWMMSGIVPAMIYYGLDVLDPKIFLFASAVVCAIVSVATGSSWSTVATVGIALLGIGAALGVSPYLAAGAIISGAYFGDKISPLSDTTNLASAMAGTDLFTHIKYMLWTTVPSFTIALLIYLAIGYGTEPSAIAVDTTALKQELLANFDTLSPVLFIVPLVVLVMVFMKFDAVVALFVGAVLGGVFAIVFQPTMITAIAGLDEVKIERPAADGEAESDEPTTRPPNYFTRAYVAFTNSMASETSRFSKDEASEFKDVLATSRLDAAKEQTGNADLTAEEFKKSDLVLDRTFPELQAKVAVAKLLKGKGMFGMLNTVWLIITAMCFGGVMEACGFLKRITDPLVGFAQSTGSLIATTTGTCIFVNATASDQYLAIVVPGRMFRDTYAERGLAPENLSRTLEDAGTVTSVLIPWNTCGAAQSGVLGIAVLSYAPFCFFNLISPLMTMAVAFIGFRIAKLKSDPEDKTATEKDA